MIYYYGYSRCSCGAITIVSSEGSFSCRKKDIKKNFPGLDLRRISRYGHTNSCGLCSDRADDLGLVSVCSGQPAAGTQMPLASDGKLHPRTIRLCEAVYIFALNAQQLFERSEVELGDARDLFPLVLQWAAEFEAKHPGPWDNKQSGTDDYLKLIDNFASWKLHEWYKSKEDMLEDNCKNGLYDCTTCANNGECVRQGQDGQPFWLECEHECEGCLYTRLCDEYKEE